MNKKFFVNQENINDCGAASLAMILNLFGKNASLNDIKEELKIDKEGVSAFDIVKLSNKYGVVATGYKNCVIDNIALPAIVHVINENKLQHFMVLLKVLNDKVLVADPASQIRYINKNDFNNIYTGIVIMFKNEKATKGLKKEKAFAIKTIILTLFLSFISIICSFLFSKVLKSFNNYSNTKYIYYMMVLFFATSFLKEIIMFIRQKVALKFEISIDKRITINTLRSLISLPHNFYNQNGSGELIAKVNDLSYIKEMIYTLVEELSINIMFLACILVVLFIANKILFLISVTMIGIIFIIDKLFLKKHFSSIYELQMKNENLNGQIGDCINGIMTIKNLSKEKFFKDGFEAHYKDFIDKNSKLNFAYQSKTIISNVISLIFKALVFVILIITKTNIYKSIFIISLNDVLISSTLELCKSQMLYANFKSAVSRLKSLKNKEELTLHSNIKIKDISFRNFSYLIDNTYVLKNVSFNIKKGSWILVCGKTGAGKSTLFKILTRQIDSDIKGIYINGKKISEFSNETVRQSITYVDQKAKLFNKTIKENIYFDRKTPDPKIEKYLAINNLDKDIIIDNANSNISGGQMEKIIIAQTLLNSGSVIIFDETTNQIDEAEERKILTFIKKYYKDKTVILISHRKGNAQLFDKIISFKNNGVKIKNKEEIDDRINKQRA